MKEIKEFIQELCDCAKPSANVVALEDATRCWCDMDGKMLFLPVYHVPGTNMYAKYWTDTHNIRKPKEYKEGYYYSSYPQRWDRKGYCDRFSDMFRPGDSAFKWAQNTSLDYLV